MIAVSCAMGACIFAARIQARRDQIAPGDKSKAKGDSKAVSPPANAQVAAKCEKEDHQPALDDPNTSLNDQDAVSNGIPSQEG